MRYITPLSTGGAGVPDDDTVSAAKLQTDAVTNAKMADDAIGVEELSASGTPSSSTFLRGDNTWTAPAGSGDTSSNTSSSVDSEVVLFSGTGGKTLKRATGTGLAVLTSGVQSASAGATTEILVGGGAVTVPVWTTAVGTGAPLRANAVINPQTGTTYTFAAADDGKLVTAANASAQTYTVPQNSDQAIPIGAYIELHVIGAGQVTLAAGTGATLNSRGGALKSTGQHAVIGLRKIGTNTFAASGDLTT